VKTRLWNAINLRSSEKDDQERRYTMYPLNPYVVEKIVRMRQEELAREAAQNRLVRECNHDASRMKTRLVKYRLLVVLGVLSALAWFLG